MSDTVARYSAFAGDRLIARGALDEVALCCRVAQASGERAPVLVFDDASSQTVELDLRGSEADVLARLRRRGDVAAAAAPRSGPGRPRLGVVAREVTLLPRHWEWLGAQPGGASAVLRRLIEEARRQHGPREREQRAQAAIDRFMRVMGGDRPHYEEASRALYAARYDDVERLTARWPRDVRDHLRLLLENVRQLEAAAHAPATSRAKAASARGRRP
ncbi:MAG TPA: DUF2239 family protein [Mizugakiibacter sp.]